MKIYDGRNSFYQWDLSQKLTSADLTVGEEIHFSNTLMKQALIVKAYALNDTEIVVNVPNILLQHAIPITVYKCKKDEVSVRTCCSWTFQVQARPKPSDYVYTEVEILNYESVAKRMDELEKNLPNEISKGIDTLVQAGYIEVYVEQKVIEKTDSLSAEISNVESIALGAEKAITYADYIQLVDTLNVLPKSFFKAGQGINIVQLEVPDVWVAYVQDTSIPYTYISDQAIADTLKTVGTLQIGYFVLAQKETQKVDLTDYAKKSQVPTLTATLKDNGAYTLTISMGVE